MVIQIKFNGRELSYEGKPFHFKGQTSLSILSNMLELANKANHLGKEINLDLARHALYHIDGEYYCKWGDVLSFGLEEEGGV